MALLEVKDLEIGYYYPLLQKLNFSLENEKKIVIKGFNGIGKSTLIKTLVGEIPSLGGSFKFAPNIKLIKILKNLHNYNQLHIKIVDRDDPSERLRNSYGYYSSYENDIHIVLDNRFFKSSLFGLKTNYNEIHVDDISILRVIYTFIHELMHFTCNNRYTQYIEIWKEHFNCYCFR